MKRNQIADLFNVLPSVASAGSPMRFETNMSFETVAVHRAFMGSAVACYRVVSAAWQTLTNPAAKGKNTDIGWPLERCGSQGT
jgi:hypothetical protein